MERDGASAWRARHRAAIQQPAKLAEVDAKTEQQDRRMKLADDLAPFFAGIIGLTAGLMKSLPYFCLLATRDGVPNKDQFKP